MSPTSGQAITSSKRPQLPVDLYLEILKFLPEGREDDTSVQTLVSCLRTSTLVRAAALSPLVWEHHYHARYTHCIAENEKQRRERTSGDWRLLYFERRRIDRDALKLVDEIRLGVGRGRQEHARTFATTLSFDVWDALKLESQIPIPPCFREEGQEQHNGDQSWDEQALPRRFWADALLGVIARYEAVGLWAKMFRLESAASERVQVPFVEALSSLSSVFNVSMHEVRSLAEYRAVVDVLT